MNVGYTASGGLNEAVFAKGAVLNYEGQNLFDVPDPVSILGRNNAGYKWLGSIDLFRNSNK
jgi:hypothetical protein